MSKAIAAFMFSIYYFFKFR